jgi:hypothetical protein
MGPACSVRPSPATRLIPATTSQERKLFVLAAGPHAALEKIRPLLERLGQRLFVIGELPGRRIW